MKNRLDKDELAKLRADIAATQGHCCALCGVNLHGQKMCLDHNHKTGRIRSVLCVNCNGIEGKVFNLARRAKRERNEPAFIQSLIDYWKFHTENPRSEIHPTHKSEDEKRLLRNKRARRKRKNRE
jgi:hypothetical protein